MVRALLNGSKTQTRRVVKSRPDRILGKRCMLLPHELAGEVNKGEYGNCPYGQPGDHLWVRETHLNWWKKDPANPEGEGLFSHVAAYAADGYELMPDERWIPSIHMLRQASRITLEITRVRIEKLHAINEVDAIAEGASWAACGSPQEGSHKAGYAQLWEKINGPDSWAANPWVWVIEFKRVQP